jgi:hypothetical protein
MKLNEDPTFKKMLEILSSFDDSDFYEDKEDAENDEADDERKEVDLKESQELENQALQYLFENYTLDELFDRKNELHKLHPDMYAMDYKEKGRKIIQTEYSLIEMTLEKHYGIFKPKDDFDKMMEGIRQNNFFTATNVEQEKELQALKSKDKKIQELLIERLLKLPELPKKFKKSTLQWCILLWIFFVQLATQKENIIVLDQNMLPKNLDRGFNLEELINSFEMKKIERKDTLKLLTCLRKIKLDEILENRFFATNKIVIFE